MRILHPIDETELRQLVAKDHTLKEMAAHFGCCEEWVRKRMIALGIPRRLAVSRKGRAYPLKARKMDQNYFWKGGRIQDKDGYWLVKVVDHPYTTRNGYVREHRLAVEKKLGRYLLPSEIVHHRDGNKENNSPDNLEIFQSNVDHLRETLKGKCPKWSPEGYQRMQQAARQKTEKAEAIQTLLKTYGQRYNLSLFQIQRRLDKSDRDLLRKAVQLGIFEPLPELRNKRETIDRDFSALVQSKKSCPQDQK